MTLSHDRAGSGEPLLLLHGIGHRRQAWRPVFDRLAEHHDVIAVDLPGFGQSPPLALAPGQPHTIEAAARAVADELDALGVARPHVAGNSLGGAIALELAKAGLAATVTALSPAGFWATRWEFHYAISVLSVSRAATFLPEPVLRFAAGNPVMRSLAYGMIFGRPRALDPETAFADSLALRDGKSFRAVAEAGAGYAYQGDPGVPTTIAWGTRDRILLRRQFRHARTVIPAARFVDLPGCGHVPMNDDPGLVAATILRTTGAA